MSIRIIGKQMDVGDALRSRIETRIGEAVEKYFDGGYSGRITLSKSNARFSADCVIHLDSGVELQAAGEAHDPNLAFDMASERIEKRLRRYNRKLKSKSFAANAMADSMDIAYRVMSGFEDEEDEVPDDFAPTIVAETRLPVKPISVAQAVMELDMKDNPVLVFRNSGNNVVNIVYRRADGNIGWIDPSLETT